jgi:pantothenate synthetase
VATALVDNSVVHWVLDAAKIIGALGVIVAALVAIGRTRVGKWLATKYRAAFTEPRDHRFAQTVHRVIKPELDEIRAEHREQLTAVKAEVRGVIESHTVEEMAGVTRQIEVAEEIKSVATQALELGKANAAELARLVDNVGLNPRETP